MMLSNTSTMREPNIRLTKTLLGFMGKDFQIGTLGHWRGQPPIPRGRNIIELFSDYVAKNIPPSPNGMTPGAFKDHGTGAKAFFGKAELGTSVTVCEHGVIYLASVTDINTDGSINIQNQFVTTVEVDDSDCFEILV